MSEELVLRLNVPLMLRLLEFAREQLQQLLRIYLEA